MDEIREPGFYWVLRKSEMKDGTYPEHAQPLVAEWRVHRRAFPSWFFSGEGWELYEGEVDVLSDRLVAPEVPDGQIAR